MIIEYDIGVGSLHGRILIDEMDEFSYNFITEKYNEANALFVWFPLDELEELTEQLNMFDYTLRRGTVSAHQKIKDKTMEVLRRQYGQDNQSI